MSLSILAVTASWLEDGSQKIAPFVEEQIRSLRAAGCRVVLGVVEDRRSAATLHRRIRAMRALVAREGIDVVHAHYGSVIGAVGLAVRRRAAYVVSFGGSDLLGVPIDGAYWLVRQNLSKAFSMAAAMGADAVIVKGAHMREALPGRVAARTHVLPNGVNIEAFAPMNRAECRRRLGWDPDAPTVVFNASRGSNMFVKNRALADAAVAVARREVASLRFVPIGEDPAALMPIILNAADCLLVTSLHEGSPNVVKEAMACNLPIVSVPCGDVCDRIDGPRVGRVCAYEAQQLGDALVDRLRTPGRSEGRTALLAQGLDSPSIGRSLARILEGVVHARRTARQT